MRVFWKLAPPIIAFLLVQALFFLAVRPKKTRWQAESWNRYDVMHYLSIAERGYEIHPCQWGDDTNAWCGNAGWLPGYPLLIRAGTWTGLAPLHAALLIAALARLTFLSIVWSTLVGCSSRASAVLTLLLVALWPGAIYHHAPFPIALFSLCALGSLMATHSRRCWLAAILGVVGAYVYSTGFLLGPVLAASALLEHRRWREAAIVGAAPALGLLAALGTQWMYLGRWNGLFLTQAHYGHGIHDPLATLRAYLIPAQWRDTDLWTAAQAATVLLLVAALVGLAHRTGWQTDDRSRVLYAMAYWLVPLLLGPRVSLYRADALLAVSAPILRRASRWVQLGLVIALAVLDYKIAIRYFRGTII